MNVPWTVLYRAVLQDGEGSTAAVGEMRSSRDIAVARKDADIKFGKEIIAMIPGLHMEKTYLFDHWHEDGAEPISVYNPRNKKWSATK
jgi:hypothetical protein